ncbi:terminase large subunit domain-containing protein [Streptomyces fradiae]|uniref:terminase large subunit domain-containing protein n=1 Tax=Streptomyces fradiae TaxID=1906 RepID=UPI0033E69BB6
MGTDLAVDHDTATEADALNQLTAAYRRLNRTDRRRIARNAGPELRAALAEVERTMALQRSPGSMAAILTDGREMQAPHLALIDRLFQRMARGERVKALITMPPRHGKSRRAARWAPLWYLTQHPDHRIMIASYGADLAEEHSRWIRDAIATYGPRIGIALHAGSKAANRFDLADPRTGDRLEGGLVAAGVGGGLTGKGAHLAIVDDPIKDAADAESPTMRRRLWEWWTAVLNTRLEPWGGRATAKKVPHQSCEGLSAACLKTSTRCSGIW